MQFRSAAPDDVDFLPATRVPYIFNYASEEYGNRMMVMDLVTLDHLPVYLDEYGH